MRVTDFLLSGAIKTGIPVGFPSWFWVRLDAVGASRMATKATAV